MLWKDIPGFPGLGSGSAVPASGSGFQWVPVPVKATCWVWWGWEPHWGLCQTALFEASCKVGWELVWSGICGGGHVGQGRPAGEHPAMMSSDSMVDGQYQK